MPKKSVKLAKVINYPVSNPKIYLKNIEGKIGVELTQKVIKRADFFVKEIKQHFKENKYNLNLSIYQSELIGDVFGDIDWYLVSRILNAGLQVGHKKSKVNQEVMISRK